jgi:hypothetical protein
VHPLDPVRRNAVLRGRRDHHFFELFDVPAHVPPQLGEIQNWVSHDLPRAVKGDVPAALGIVKLDVHLPQNSVTGAQMPALAIAAQGDHREMLAQEQHIRHLAGLARGHRSALEFQRARIADCAQIDHPARCLRVSHFLFAFRKESFV